MLEERTREDKKVVRKRGWTRQQRYYNEWGHETSKFRYSNLFYGHFHKFCIFGHKANDYRRVKVERDENFRDNKYQCYRSRKSPSRNRNPFDSLMNDVEFLKCNNFGHKVSEWRSIF